MIEADKMADIFFLTGKCLRNKITAVVGKSKNLL